MVSAQFLQFEILTICAGACLEIVIRMLKTGARSGANVGMRFSFNYARVTQIRIQLGLFSYSYRDAIGVRCKYSGFGKL